MLMKLMEVLYKEFPVKDDLRHGIILNKDHLVLFVQFPAGAQSFSVQPHELVDTDKLITDIRMLMRGSPLNSKQKKIKDDSTEEMA